eukprot:1160564-Pelagomonas_calceolata.AAC.4
MKLGMQICQAICHAHHVLLPRPLQHLVEYDPLGSMYFHATNWLAPGSRKHISNESSMGIWEQQLT